MGRVRGLCSGGGDEHLEDLAELVEQAPVSVVSEAPQEDTLGSGLVQWSPEEANHGGAVAVEVVVGVH